MPFFYSPLIWYCWCLTFTSQTTPICFVLYSTVSMQLVNPRNLNPVTILCIPGNSFFFSLHVSSGKKSVVRSARRPKIELFMTQICSNLMKQHYTEIIDFYVVSLYLQSWNTFHWYSLLCFFLPSYLISNMKLINYLWDKKIFSPNYLTSVAVWKQVVIFALHLRCNFLLLHFSLISPGSLCGGVPLLH